MNVKCFKLPSVKAKPLVISLLIPLAVGVLSNLISGNINKVYAALDKPAFAPPGWIFPVIWGILYILMGLASYIIYETPCPIRKHALTAYGIQLGLNSFWTFIFFRMQTFLFALIWLGMIIIAATITAVYFYKIKKCAAYLLIPYILWLGFAFVLNACMYFLN